MANRTSRFVRRTSKVFTKHTEVSSPREEEKKQAISVMKTCIYCGTLFSKEEADSHRWTFLFIFTLGSSKSCAECHEGATMALDDANAKLGLSSSPSRLKNKRLSRAPVTVITDAISNDDTQEVLQ